MYYLQSSFFAKDLDLSADTLLLLSLSDFLAMKPWLLPNYMGFIPFAILFRRMDLYISYIAYEKQFVIR